MSTDTDSTRCLLCDEDLTETCDVAGNSTFVDVPTGEATHDDGTPHQPRVEHQFGAYQPREWDTGFPGGHECQVCGEWFNSDDLDRDDLHCEA